MNARTALSVIFRLVKDTFRQSMAAGICWLLMGVSTICILGCLSVSVSGPRSLTPPGENATFLGAEEHLRANGVKVEVAQDPACIQLMRDFIAKNPQLWNEDIGV